MAKHVFPKRTGGGPPTGGKPTASVTEISKARQVRAKLAADQASLQEHSSELGDIQAGIHEYLKRSFADATPQVVASATMLYSARVAYTALGMNSKAFSQAAKQVFKDTQRELGE